MRFPKELEELTLLPNWVVYRLFNNGSSKLSKLPFNPTTHSPAKTNDPTTWSTFPVAVNCLVEHSYDGIGFMFSNGYVGIDLDECIENDTMNSFSSSIVSLIDSYTEYSPSMKGVHILLKSTSNQNIGYKHNNIEIYNNNRFFTITGKVVVKKPIMDRTEELDYLLRTLKYHH